MNEAIPLPIGLSIVIPCFRDGERALALARALEGCVPAQLATEIVIVDDGSGDGTAGRLAEAAGGRVRVLALPENLGRAAARQAGVANSSGERLLFIDCDCLPADDRLILEHLAGWTRSTIASIGPVVGDGRGFWSRYQDVVAERRARQHREGMSFSGSGTNLMVSRHHLLACGGFDPSYPGYGFEDRDLLIRLAGRGQVRWAALAVVRHMDALDLPSVCRKMMEAGGSAALHFQRSHPEAYRRLGYALLDARQHAWLSWPARLAAPIAPRMARALNPLLGKRWIPFGAKSLIVKLVSALGFLAGTAR